MPTSDFTAGDLELCSQVIPWNTSVFCEYTERTLYDADGSSPSMMSGVNSNRFLTFYLMNPTCPIEEQNERLCVGKVRMRPISCDRAHEVFQMVETFVEKLTEREAHWTFTTDLLKVELSGNKYSADGEQESLAFFEIVERDEQNGDSPLEIRKRDVWADLPIYQFAVPYASKPSFFPFPLPFVSQ